MKFLKINKKKNILSILLVSNCDIKEIFIDFTKLDFSIYENEHSIYYNVQQYYLKQAKFNIINNIYKIKEHILTIYYKGQYIKGTNGKKELYPYNSIINNNSNYSNLFPLIRKYYGIKDEYKIVKKISKYNNDVKIQKYKILFSKNSTYFKLLSNDIIQLICNYVL